MALHLAPFVCLMCTAAVLICVNVHQQDKAMKRSPMSKGLWEYAAPQVGVPHCNPVPCHHDVFSSVG